MKMNKKIEREINLLENQRGILSECEQKTVVVVVVVDEYVLRD